MCAERVKLTAFGRWARTQPRGTLSRIARDKALAWSTVSDAQKKLMSDEVAIVLADVTGGEVTAEQIAKDPGSVRRTLDAAIKTRRRSRRARSAA